MPKNPFHEELDDTFRGTRVRVHASGHVYEGWARLWHYNQPAIVLYDAVREDGQALGAVTIDDPDVVERLGSRGTIEEVPVDAIADSPYSAREHDDTSHQYFVKLTRERGHLLTYPTVRVRNSSDDTETTHEVVGGHRRIEAARRASLDTIPVRVVALTDWEAVEHFVDEHIPIPGANEHDLYSPDEIERAIDELRADWPDDALLELGPLEPHLRKQLANTRKGRLRQEGEE
jgi:hypothetical protein